VEILGNRRHTRTGDILLGRRHPLARTQVNYYFTCGTMMKDRPLSLQKVQVWDWYRHVFWFFGHGSIGRYKQV